MSGNKTGIEQFFKPVKIQPNKTNDVSEDGIGKIPQSQARRVDSSTPYHPEKVLDSPKLYLETKGDPTSIMNDSKNMMPLVTP